MSHNVVGQYLVLNRVLIADITNASSGTSVSWLGIDVILIAGFNVCDLIVGPTYFITDCCDHGGTLGDVNSNTTYLSVCLHGCTHTYVNTRTYMYRYIH